MWKAWKLRSYKQAQEFRLAYLVFKATLIKKINLIFNKNVYATHQCKILDTHES